MGADVRKGKVVEPFRFAVGVTQMQGAFLAQAKQPSGLKVVPRGTKESSDAGYDASCIRNSKA